MKKSLKTTAATTAIAALLFTTNQIVNAEEASTEAPKADATETTAPTREVNKEEVAKAEESYHVAEKEVETTKAEVAKKEKEANDLTVRKQELEATIKETNAITPKVIEKAENDVKQAETAKTAAETELTSKAKLLEEPRKAFNEGEEAFKKATTVVEELKGRVEKAEKEKERIEKATSAEIVKQAQDEVEVAKKEVEKAEKELNDGRAKVLEAETFDSELETKKNDAKKEMDAAAKLKEEKSEVAKDLKGKADTAQEELKKSAGVNAYGDFPTDIKLDEGFVKAFKAFMDFKNSDASKTLKATNKAEYDRQYEALRHKVLEAEMKVINSPENKKYTVGTSNLSKESYANPRIDAVLAKTMRLSTKRLFSKEPDPNQTLYDSKDLPQDVIEELNHYGVAVFNSIREQFGLSPVKVNKKALAMAADIANAVEEVPYTDAGHHLPSITEVAKNYQLVADGNNYYENLFTTKNTRHVLKEELFANMLVAMVGFFYEGHTRNGNEHYGHASGLYNGNLGYGFGFSYPEPKEEIGKDKGAFKIHVISTQNGAAGDKMHEWGNEAPYVLEPKAVYDSALKQKADEAVSKYNEAKKEVETATANYNKAKQNYEAIAQTPKKTAVAKENYKTLEAALNTVKTAHSDKVKYLDSLKDAATNKEKALAEVDKELNDAKEEKKKADEALKVQKEKFEAATVKYTEALKNYTDAEKQVKEAKEAVTKAEQELARLKGLTENLEKNTKALADTSKQLEVATDTWNSAKELLKKAQEKLDVTKKEWMTLKERYDLQEKVKLAEAKPMPKPNGNAAVTPGSNGPTTPSKPEAKPTQQIAKPQPSATANTTVAAPSAPTAVAQVTPASKGETLPETGEASTAWFTLASVAVLASLGLVATKRPEDV